MKLQDAYASETGALGPWKLIGYVGPGTANENGSATTVFTYKGAKVASKTTCTDGYTWDEDAGLCKDKDGNKGATTGSSIDNGWVAHNNTQLNDCAPGDHWDVSAKIGLASSNTGSVTYSHSGLSTECEQLTPQFANIGR